MKEALNFYSIIKYSNSIILDVDEVNNNILKSTVDLEYLKNFDKKIFIEMIESYNYSAAYLFIKNSKINNVEIYNYTSYLLNRYNFNFEKSNNNLKDIKSKVINEFNIINLENEKILDNRINYLETMIFELFDNIEITFEK
ncbi:hypothetical protein HOG21_07170 [bacterium]|nr:hypothetical protein [bacterium]